MGNNNSKQSSSNSAKRVSIDSSDSSTMDNIKSSKPQTRKEWAKNMHSLPQNKQHPSHPDYNPPKGKWFTGGIFARGYQGGGGANSTASLR